MAEGGTSWGWRNSRVQLDIETELLAAVAQPEKNNRGLFFAIIGATVASVIAVGLAVYLRVKMLHTFEMTYQALSEEPEMFANPMYSACGSASMLTG